MSNNRNTAWGGTGGDGTATVVGSGPQGEPVQNAKYYGAAGDGVTDDTAAINAAISAAASPKGGTVWLPAGTYKVSSTLSIGDTVGTGNSSYNGVVLRGEGQGAVDAFGTPPTKLSWAGSSGGSVVKINGPIGNWGLHDIQISGGAGAAKGLEVVSGQSGSVSGLQVSGCTDGIYLTTAAGGNHGTSFNIWQNIAVYVHSVTNSHAIFVDGNADALSNTCYDLFDGVYVNYVLAGATPFGLYLKRTDNLRFRHLLFANSAGKNTITFDYTGNSGWPCDVVIEQVDLGSATAVVNNVGTPPLVNGGATLINRIIDVSRGNGRPADPVLQGLEFGTTTYGTGTITFPGGSTQSNGATFPHSLGVTPKTVTAIPTAFSGVNVCPVLENMGAFNDGTNIAIRATTVDGQTPLNTATVTVAWMARG